MYLAMRGERIIISLVFVANLMKTQYGGCQIVRVCLIIFSVSDAEKGFLNQILRRHSKSYLVFGKKPRSVCGSKEKILLIY